MISDGHFSRSSSAVHNANCVGSAHAAWPLPLSFQSRVLTDDSSNLITGAGRIGDTDIVYRKPAQSCYNPWPSASASASAKGMQILGHQSDNCFGSPSSALVGAAGASHPGQGRSLISSSTSAADSSPPALSGSSRPSSPSDPSVPTTPSQTPFSPASLPNGFTTQSLLEHLELDLGEDPHSLSGNQSHSISDESQATSPEFITAASSSSKQLSASANSTSQAGFRRFPELIDFSSQIIPSTGSAYSGCSLSSGSKQSEGRNSESRQIVPQVPGSDESRVTEEINYLTSILDPLTHSLAARGSNELQGLSSENWLGLGSCVADHTTSLRHNSEAAAALAFKKGNDSFLTVHTGPLAKEEITSYRRNLQSLASQQQQPGGTEFMASEQAHRLSQSREDRGGGGGGHGSNPSDEIEKILRAYNESPGLGMPSLASPSMTGTWSMIPPQAQAPSSGSLTDSSCLFGPSFFASHGGHPNTNNPSDFNDAYWTSLADEQSDPVDSKDNILLNTIYGSGFASTSNPPSSFQYGADSSSRLSRGASEITSEIVAKQEISDSAPTSSQVLVEASYKTIGTPPGVTVSASPPCSAAAAATSATLVGTPNSSMSSSSIDGPDDDTTALTDAAVSTCTSAKSAKRKTPERDESEEKSADPAAPVAAAATEANSEPKKGQPLPKRKKGPKNPRPREPRFAIQTRSEVEIMDDSYRWRKYGQKAVKNSPYPRSYYRCTNNKCPVRKRVERSSEDPGLVITTYEGTHNHLSPATRPSTSSESAYHHDQRGLPSFLGTAGSYQFAQAQAHGHHGQPPLPISRNNFDLVMQLGGSHGPEATALLQRVAAQGHPHARSNADYLGSGPQVTSNQALGSMLRSSTAHVQQHGGGEAVSHLLQQQQHVLRCSPAGPTVSTQEMFLSRMQAQDQAAQAQLRMQQQSESQQQAVQRMQCQADQQVIVQSRMQAQDHQHVQRVQLQRMQQRRLASQVVAGGSSAADLQLQQHQQLHGLKADPHNGLLEDMFLPNAALRGL